MKDQTFDSKKKDVTKPAVLAKEGTKMSKAKTVLNGSNEAITNTEANKKFHERIADISGSLRGIHKYQCASDECSPSALVGQNGLIV